MISIPSTAKRLVHWYLKVVPFKNHGSALKVLIKSMCLENFYDLLSDAFPQTWYVSEFRNIYLYFTIELKTARLFLLFYISYYFLL